MIPGRVPEQPALEQVRPLGRPTQGDFGLFFRANCDAVLSFRCQTIPGCVNIVIPMDEPWKGKAARRVPLGSVRMITGRELHRHTCTTTSLPREWSTVPASLPSLGSHAALTTSVSVRTARNESAHRSIARSRLNLTQFYRLERGYRASAAAVWLKRKPVRKDRQEVG